MVAMRFKTRLLNAGERQTDFVRFHEGAEEMLVTAMLSKEQIGSSSTLQRSWGERYHKRRVIYCNSALHE